eukprot:2193487-Rhodomonas_salina.1
MRGRVRGRLGAVLPTVASECPARTAPRWHRTLSQSRAALGTFAGKFGRGVGGQELDDRHGCWARREKASGTQAVWASGTELCTTTLCTMAYWRVVLQRCTTGAFLRMVQHSSLLDSRERGEPNRHDSDSG